MTTTSKVTSSPVQYFSQYTHTFVVIFCDSKAYLRWNETRERRTTSSPRKSTSADGPLRCQLIENLSSKLFRPDSLQDLVEKHYHRTLWETCDLWDIRSEWWGDITWPNLTLAMTMTLRKQGEILKTCDLWGTDYISDNWKQQSQHS